MVLQACSRRRSLGRGSSFPGSQKVDYSLYFLSALSRAVSTRSTRVIAREGGLSFSFLQKVAHLLKRAGLVDAVRGKEGGYVLARPGTHITLKHVIEAVDGKALPFACAEHPRIRARCPRKNFCVLRTAVGRMHRQVAQTYLSKTLADIIV